MADFDFGVSEESDVDSGAAEEVEVPDLNHLKPFDMEPKRKVDYWEGDFSIESERSSDSETEYERVGNIEWCDCGKRCQPMETYTESLCCQDTNEIPEHMFAGKLTY